MAQTSQKSIAYSSHHLELAGIVPDKRPNLLALPEMVIFQSSVMILLTSSVFPTVQSVEGWPVCLQSSTRAFPCLNCSFVTKSFFKHSMNFWCSVLSVKWNIMQTIKKKHELCLSRTIINTHWEAMQRAMPAKLSRLTQNILYDIMVPSDRKLYYSFRGPSSEYRN